MLQKKLYALNASNTERLKRVLKVPNVDAKTDGKK